MPTVRGCSLPDDLLYDVDNNIWFKEIGDGSVRIGMTAVGDEVMAVNDKVIGKTDLANTDPYGEGWLVVLKPENWGGVKAGLTPGAEVGPKYEAKMTADNFEGCKA
jgi:glycine cleavage system H protein